MNPTVIGNPISGAASGALGNGTYCTLLAPTLYGGSGYSLLPQSLQQIYCQALENPSYNISLGAAVTAGTVTFQELYWDMTTWLPLASPAPVSLVTATATAYNGAFPQSVYLGLRAVVTGITGGTIQSLMLKAAIRSL